ncbi:MAG: hypothetical protein ACQESE_04080 [Nanobdellota archaeon]
MKSSILKKISLALIASSFLVGEKLYSQQDSTNQHFQDTGVTISAQDTVSATRRSEGREISLEQALEKVSLSRKDVYSLAGYWITRTDYSRLMNSSIISKYEWWLYQDSRESLQPKKTLIELLSEEIFPQADTMTLSKNDSAYHPDKIITFDNLKAFNRYLEETLIPSLNVDDVTYKTRYVVTRKTLPDRWMARETMRSLSEDESEEITLVNIGTEYITSFGLNNALKNIRPAFKDTMKSYGIEFSSEEDEMDHLCYLIELEGGGEFDRIITEKEYVSFVNSYFGQDSEMHSLDTVDSVGSENTSPHLIYDRIKTPSDKYISEKLGERSTVKFGPCITLTSIKNYLKGQLSSYYQEHPSFSHDEILSTICYDVETSLAEDERDIDKVITLQEFISYRKNRSQD